MSLVVMSSVGFAWKIGKFMDINLVAIVLMGKRIRIEKTLEQGWRDIFIFGLGES